MKLNLPGTYVPDRVSTQRTLAKGERSDFAVLDGPGCIKRFWCVPVRENKHWENRRIWLRIYFDDEKTPSVNAPIGDFFGVMHGQPYYPINTPYISVQESSGYTCYFEMPFEKSARVELEADSDVQSYVAVTVDWHRYPNQRLAETRRFHALWRRENPTESYGREYVLLDANGPGDFMGFFYGVRLYDNEDRWSHGGADNIYLDGGGENPAYLRGLGGEDTFGVGYGGVLHKPETHLQQGMPYYVHEDTGEARAAQRVTGYRFFAYDAIHFHESVHMRFGCMKNDICSTVYWYQNEPHAQMPDGPMWDALLPPSKTGNSGLITIPDSGSWLLYGPYGNADNAAMETCLPPEGGNTLGENPDGMHPAGSLWLTKASVDAGLNIPGCKPYKAFHGFVDFRHVFRPHARGVSPTEEGVAIAHCVLRAPRDMQAVLRLTFDDSLVLRVNDQVFDMGFHHAFRIGEQTVTLQKGVNIISVKNSNTVGSNKGGWTFNFQAVGTDGTRFIPEAE